MHKLPILLVPILMTLIGCTATMPLKPSPDIYSYYITPGAGFSATQLCGLSPSGERCLQMLDGRKVTSVINGYFVKWLPSLKGNETIIAISSQKESYLLPQAQGIALLQALIEDNRQRARDRWDQDDR